MMHARCSGTEICSIVFDGEYCLLYNDPGLNYGESCTCHSHPVINARRACAREL